MTVGIRAARGDQPVPQRTGRVISRTGAQLLAAAIDPRPTRRTVEPFERGA